MDALIAEYRATGTLAGLPQGHWIGGQWCPAVAGRRLDSSDPGTGRCWQQFAAGDADDVALAVQSSDRALQGGWRQVPPAERGRILQRAAQGVLAQADRLAVASRLPWCWPMRISTLQWPTWRAASSTTPGRPAPQVRAR